MNRPRMLKLLSLLGIVLTAEIAMSSDAGVEVQANIDMLLKSNNCSGCNLVGANLNRLDLAEADLSGADLSGATFFLSDLSGANLQNAVLRGAQFGGADLANADLRGADLRGAETKGAYITGAQFDGSFQQKSISDDSELADIEEQIYIQDDAKPKQMVENKKVKIPEANVVDVKKEADPEPQQTEEKITSGVKSPSDLQESLQAPPVKKAQPVGTIMIEQKTEEAATTAAETSGLKISQQEGSADKINDSVEAVSREPEKKDEETSVGVPPQKNEQSQMQIESVEAVTAGSATQQLLATLEDTNKCYKCLFSGINLAGKDLEEADLEGADFSNANLQDVDFEDANLKGVSFKDANLKDAKFNGADLYKADFSGADLSGAEFEDAKTDEADFTGAKGYLVNMVTAPQ